MYTTEMKALVVAGLPVLRLPQLMAKEDSTRSARQVQGWSF